jgi:hypothetical protein
MGVWRGEWEDECYWCEIWQIQEVLMFACC